MPIHLSSSLAGCIRLSAISQVSGSSAVSNSFVSPYNDSCVSQSGWWCPALWLPPIHLPHVNSLCRNSFVSQCGWWVLLFGCLELIHLFQRITLHLSPSPAGGVRLFRCLQFICLRLIPFKGIHLSLSLAGDVWLFGCLQCTCLPL